ncbi:hypothetical protein Taro_045410 [Colocasia esculenta]|uniref:tRNA (guanine-N(7)-)-methyltransferase n=1 Tax=Colocasia esculenta TaxID=4460 RepID=A0A843X2Q3_COLES|nr:hypothetical protein [Colocasia esculenta]
MCIPSHEKYGTERYGEPRPKPRFLVGNLEVANPGQFLFSLRLLLAVSLVPAPSPAVRRHSFPRLRAAPSVDTAASSRRSWWPQKEQQRYIQRSKVGPLLKSDRQMASNGHKSHLPRKRFYRARAHSNPLSDSHFPIPISPSDVDYSQHFPAFFPVDRDGTDGNLSIRKIHFADIGCGFGGLLVNLSTMFPDTLMIGMELRDKVTEYVKERILALRAANPGLYENISVVRTNSMKYIPNYFEKGQLSKMFFLFPDPHFKEKNHRRRVISLHLLDEYAYALQVGGLIYTITDVEELGDWMKSCLENHPLFEAVSESELKADPVVKLLTSATEEGQKVARNGGQTYQAIYRRVVQEEE